MIRRQYSGVLSVVSAPFTRCPTYTRRKIHTETSPGVLNGQRCIITGGSRGLGLAIAKKFASNGASCVLIARNEESLNQAVQSLPVTGDGSQNHRFHVMDVSNPTGLTPEILKGTTILVNSAGISQNSLLSSLPASEVRNLVDLNLVGSILMSQALIKPMMRMKRGCIINLSSVLAVKGTIGTSVYAATKAGIEGFSRSLAVELGSRNIRVNAIAPGLAATDMSQDITDSASDQFSSAPLKTGLISPEAVADAALYLATASQVTGSIMYIDNGFTAQ